MTDATRNVLPRNARINGMIGLTARCMHGGIGDFWVRARGPERTLAGYFEADMVAVLCAVCIFTCCFVDFLRPSAANNNRRNPPPAGSNRACMR